MAGTKNRRATGSQGTGPDVESIAKALALAGLFFYVLGLLTVNAYLAQWGISDFSPLKPRFIFTGALISVFALFPFAFAAIVVRILRALLQEIQRPSEKEDVGPFRRFIRSTASFCAGFFISFLPFIGLLSLFTAFYLLLRTSTLNSDDAFKNALELNALALGAGIAAWILWRGHRRRWLVRLPWNKTIRLGPPWRALVVSLAISLLGSFVIIFGRSAFPTIPETFGGGRPKLAMFLVVGADNVQGYERLINPRVPSLQTSALLSPLECLLFQTDDAYLIKLGPQAPVIQISKDLVSGIRVHAEVAGCPVTGATHS